MKVKILTLILVILCILPSFWCLAISPGNIYLELNPNSIYKGNFLIINNKDSEANISIFTEGDLSSYISELPPNIHLKPRENLKLNYTIALPDNLYFENSKTKIILSEEIPVNYGKINAKIEVVYSINAKINLSSTNTKYTSLSSEPKFSVKTMFNLSNESTKVKSFESEVMPEQMVIFEAEIYNPNPKTTSGVAKINIYDGEKSISSLETGRFEIASGGSANLSAVWNASDLPEKEYLAVLSIDYNTNNPIENISVNSEEDNSIILILLMILGIATSTMIILFLILKIFK